MQQNALLHVVAFSRVLISVVCILLHFGRVLREYPVGVRVKAVHSVAFGRVLIENTRWGLGLSLCILFTSLLQARVTFCSWLIKENWVFWLEPVALGSDNQVFQLGRVGPQNRVHLPGPTLRAGFGNRVSVPEPEPTLAGTRFFKRVEPRFRFSIWNRVEPGNRRNRPSLVHKWRLGSAFFP